MPRLINKHMDHPDVVVCIARRCAKSVIQEWCTEAMDIISSQTFDSEVVDAETVVKLREQMRKSRDCRKAAKAALKQWYHRALCDAEEQIAKVQLDENLFLLRRVQDWHKQKNIKDGYFMMVTPHNWEPRPVILKLDYTDAAYNEDRWGGLTKRQLHQQIREHLKLKPVDSLRIRKFRPWLMYMVENFPIPESSALFCNDDQCRDLMGTTLLICWWRHDHCTKYRLQNRSYSSAGAF